MKRGYVAEHERQKQLEKIGYRVFRVSGSIGAGDLLAVMKKERRGCYEVFIEQVKSVRGNIFYFDRKAKDEWERLAKEEVDAFFVVRYSYKRKVYWRIVKVEGPPPKKLVLDVESKTNLPKVVR